MKSLIFSTTHRLSRRPVRFATVAVLGLIATAAHPSAGQVYTHSEPAPGVHLFRPDEQGAGNVVAVAAGREAIVIDASPSPLAAASIIAQLEALGIDRVRYLINTHWHHDHTLGNQAFMGASIVAHHETGAAYGQTAIPDLGTQIEGLSLRLAQRDSLLLSGRDEDGTSLSEVRRAALESRQAAFRSLLDGLRQVRPTPPEILFGQRLELRVGSRRVEVSHHGPGHSMGDVVVWVPDVAALVTGDLVTLPVPAAAAGYSSILGWEGALAALRTYPFDVLVPGHGPALFDRTYLDDLHALMVTLHVEAQRSRATGLEAGEAVGHLDVSAFSGRYLETARDSAAFRTFFLNPAWQILHDELSARNRSAPNPSR